MSRPQARKAAYSRTTDWPALHLATWFHRNARGEALRWDNRLWMVDILKDKAEKLVLPKASKVGVSELLFVKMMAEAINKKNGMYILPTDGVRNRLVSTRIDPVIQATPLYRNNCSKGRKASDSKSLKTLFQAHWNFVGSRSPENFYEFDSDFLAFDEYDRCDHNNLGLAMDRIGSAADERWWKVGNPSIADFGIDAEYKLTDMRRWMIKCEACNEWHRLDWFDHFVRQDDAGQWLLQDTGSPSLSGGYSSDACPICTHCAKPMNRLAQGEWVAEHPDRPIHGYMADRLFGAPGNDYAKPRHIIRETLKYWNEAQGHPTDLQTFYNNRLGIPFEADGSKLTMALLGQAQSDYLMPVNSENCVAGVDVGKVLHVSISLMMDGRIRKKMFVGTVKDWDELQQVCHRYGVQRGVVDAMPELHAAEDWCAEHAGWFRCFYSKSDTAKKPIDVDVIQKTISCNKTAVCDNLFQDYTQGYISLPSNWRTLDNGDFVKQMLAPTRIFDEEKGRFIWDEGNSPDHHFHAGVYEGLAASMVTSGSLIQ